MRDDELWGRLRKGLRRQQLERLLRAESEEEGSSAPSDRTYVQPEGRQGDAPAPSGPKEDGRERRYCFELDRMRRTWRDDDRRSDAAGRPAAETVGASEARRRWSELLLRVLRDGALLRIRHQRHDSPAVLLREANFRDLERRAGQTPSPP